MLLLLLLLKAPPAWAREMPKRQGRRGGLPPGPAAPATGAGAVAASSWLVSLLACAAVGRSFVGWLVCGVCGVVGLVVESRVEESATVTHTGLDRWLMMRLDPPPAQFAPRAPRQRAAADRCRC